MRVNVRPSAAWGSEALDRDRFVRAGRGKQRMSAQCGGTGDGQRLAKEFPPPGIVIVLAHGASFINSCPDEWDSLATGSDSRSPAQSRKG